MKKHLLSIALIALSSFCMGQGFPPMNMEVSKDLYSKSWENVNYGNDGKEYHNMDIYLPKGEQKSYKAVIVIYGSAWFANNMKGMTMTSIGAPLLKAGFAVVTINHRSSQDAIWPAQIQDVKAAIRYVRACAGKYDIDPSFIGISGFSSGGHLSTFAAVTNGVKTINSGDLTVDVEGNLGEYTSTSSKVDGVVDWFGPVDMARFENCSEPNGSKSPETALIGGKNPKESPDWVKVISPLYYVSKDAPEMLIIHGDADNVVPHCLSVNLKAAYDKVGVKCNLVTVPGGGHGPGCFDDKYYQMMVDYFVNHSK